MIVWAMFFYNQQCGRVVYTRIITINEEMNQPWQYRAVGPQAESHLRLLRKTLSLGVGG